MEPADERSPWVRRAGPATAQLDPHAPRSLVRPAPDTAGDLPDVARRIGRYWWLIALLVGAGAVAGLAHGDERSYTATARIVLDTPDPATRQEAVAIGDTVKAIATSPAQVQSALRRAGVQRDPLDVAEHHVSATVLGSSAIVKLSVSDTDSRIAARIANTLALQVIQAREQVTRGTSERQLSELDSQITSLSSKMSQLDSAIAALNADIAAATTTDGARGLRMKRDAASRQHDLLAQRRAVLESARVSVLASLATRAKPSIISSAEPPTHTDPSGRLQYMVLGGLLGLILAVAFAAILEMIRPTVVGGDVLAAELGVPLLGTFSRRNNIREQDLLRAAVRIQLAADAAESVSVELIAWPPEERPNELPAALQRTTAALGLEVEVPGADAAARAIRNREHPAGVVLVSPSALKRRDLLEILDVLALGRSTLLGLVVYAPSAPFRDSLAVRLDAVRAHARRGSAEAR